jgi:hypothetical protein
MAGSFSCFFPLRHQIDAFDAYLCSQPLTCGRVDVPLVTSTISGLDEISCWPHAQVAPPGQHYVIFRHMKI